MPDTLLSPAQTAARLPYPALAREIAALLTDPAVQVPPRLVQPLPGGGSLFVMPAHDARVAITKLISYTPANAGTGRPAIQGDVVVFDIATGERHLVLDGPTVTARRTAAVSLLAAQTLAPNPQGPLLIVGAGVQGRAHLEAFAAGLGLREVKIASRGAASAQALAAYARTLGLQADVVADPNEALADCPMVVTCTPASGVVLRGTPRPDAFIAAVGAFTPRMVELAPELCRHFADRPPWWWTRATRTTSRRPAAGRAGREPLCHLAGCAARREKPAAINVRAGPVQELRLGRLGSGRGAAARRAEPGRTAKDRQVFGSVTPCCPWYLPPRSL
jgi:1-piperideine-2-carboxylate/1-pyrroline-2-carboxylate reductase [NAD(P)H]